jgi:uncharacterized C2H2 Zn-finger protein
MNNKFTTIVRPLKCPYCGREFISSTEYGWHIKDHEFNHDSPVN